MELYNSFSIVHFTGGYCSLNSANVPSMFVSFNHSLKNVTYISKVSDYFVF
jgi:hypothetical protein